MWHLEKRKHLDLTDNIQKIKRKQKHTRECFVVAEEGADLAQIENDIKTMPNYFSDYDTTVHFISEEELKRDHRRFRNPEKRAGMMRTINRHLKENRIKEGQSQNTWLLMVLICCDQGYKIIFCLLRENRWVIFHSDLKVFVICLFFMEQTVKNYF